MKTNGFHMIHSFFSLKGWKIGSLLDVGRIHVHLRDVSSTCLLVNIYLPLSTFAIILYSQITILELKEAVGAEWSRYRFVAGFVTSSSPVPLKTCRVGERCTLNLSRAQTSSRWCGVVVRRGGASSSVVHVT
ncbi:uncharacterized protein TNCV_1711661 [Trichonephila clavipes]|nr:uncharacterized protein TNCV_1711661 [Trichonephila clavipes]